MEGLVVLCEHFWLFHGIKCEAFEGLGEAVTGSDLALKESSCLLG